MISYDTERDLGDFDASEVAVPTPSVWHSSYAPASLPPPPAPATPVGREHLQTVKSICRKPKPPQEGRVAFKSRTSWSDTPEGFKRLLARSAGLDAAVCDKHDRDLTEIEKAAIRAAAGRLVKLAEQVFAI
jgi:hypothetical protein